MKVLFETDFLEYDFEESDEDDVEDFGDENDNHSDNLVSSNGNEPEEVIEEEGSESTPDDHDEAISSLKNLSIKNKSCRPYRDERKAPTADEIRERVKKRLNATKTVAGSKGRNKVKTTKKKEIKQQLVF